MWKVGRGYRRVWGPQHLQDAMFSRQIPYPDLCGNLLALMTIPTQQRKWLGTIQLLWTRAKSVIWCSGTNEMTEIRCKCRATRPPRWLPADIGSFKFNQTETITFKPFSLPLHLFWYYVKPGIIHCYRLDLHLTDTAQHITIQGHRPRLKKWRRLLFSTQAEAQSHSF